MKYFLHLAYKGTAYQGWQRQANGLGVQAVIEDQLSRMFRQTITLHGCGRTDAGVHASQYFAHFVMNDRWDFDAVFRLNKMLPPDIRVFEIIPIAKDANAQLDVLHRTYDYFIHTQPNPFQHDLSTYYALDSSRINEMKRAAAMISAYTDFKSFCKRPNLYPHTNCQVFHSELSVNERDNSIRFRITANRFLQAMVRMLVGHLVWIGQGQLDLGEFKQLLERPRLNEQPTFTYPQGLYLAKVTYPYLERAVASNPDFDLKKGG
ncbi:MAG: tRNA pseudouridine(38-40) synthase TruA [Bacteroidota bacterium]